MHNPFENGEDFEEYLKRYHHGTMILNVKSERIEHRILEMIKMFGCKGVFFSGFNVSDDQTAIGTGRAKYRNAIFGV